MDLAAGEWVPQEPCRKVHGYRISQLFSSKVDPGDILREYQRTRFPERFYNRKIGVVWADLDHRVDRMSVLALCGQEPMLERSEARCTMGVDTGRELHVIISRRIPNSRRRRVVYLGVQHGFEELDELMARFRVSVCVLDALPETHSSQAFARRHGGRVFLIYFSDSQKGATRWDFARRIVQGNRTEILDASRRAIRERMVELPRRTPRVEEFASHMAAIAKRLEEDEQSGCFRRAEGGGSGTPIRAPTSRSSAARLWCDGRAPAAAKRGRHADTRCGGRAETKRSA